MGEHAASATAAYWSRIAARMQWPHVDRQAHVVVALLVSLGLWAACRAPTTTPASARPVVGPNSAGALPSPRPISGDAHQTGNPGADAATVLPDGQTGTDSGADFRCGDRVPVGARRLDLALVQIRCANAKRATKGTGTIVHSSRARGTFVLTNWHVVERAETDHCEVFAISSSCTGRDYPMRIVAKVDQPDPLVARSDAIMRDMHAIQAQLDRRDPLDTSATSWRLVRELRRKTKGLVAAHKTECAAPAPTLDLAVLQLDTGDHFAALPIVGKPIAAGVGEEVTVIFRALTGDLHADRLRMVGPACFEPHINPGTSGSPVLQNATIVGVISNGTYLVKLTAIQKWLRGAGLAWLVQGE